MVPEFVRFRVADSRRFDALCAVVSELALVKNTWLDDSDEGSDVDYDFEQLKSLMPPEVQARFDWGTAPLARDAPVGISAPGVHLGERWDFHRIVDLIDIAEYSIDGCVYVAAGLAELRVTPQSFPFGGLNPLAALVEGFGFTVETLSDSRFRPA